jgi:hypothetical protein
LTVFSGYHLRASGNVLDLHALQAPKYSTAFYPFADAVFDFEMISPQGKNTRPTVRSTASRHASVQYKGQTHLRAISSVTQTSFALHPYIRRTVVMHFFKSTIVFALAFVTFAVAAPGGTTLEVRGGGGDDGGDGDDCKPLLQSCSVNSECCADLCVAGVSVHIY